MRIHIATTHGQHPVPTQNVETFFKALLVFLKSTLVINQENNNRQRAKATSRIKLLSTQPPKDNASSILIDHRANTVPTEISASDVNKYAARLLDRLFT